MWNFEKNVKYVKNVFYSFESGLGSFRLFHMLKTWSKSTHLNAFFKNNLDSCDSEMQQQLWRMPLLVPTLGNLMIHYVDHHHHHPQADALVISLGCAIGSLIIGSRDPIHADISIPSFFIGKWGSKVDVIGTLADIINKKWKLVYQH